MQPKFNKSAPTRAAGMGRSQKQEREREKMGERNFGCNYATKIQ